MNGKTEIRFATAQDIPIILDFIKSNGYTCPEYISSYNEFSREQNDAELVLLKTMLFKQERC